MCLCRKQLSNNIQVLTVFWLLTFQRPHISFFLPSWCKTHPFACTRRTSYWTVCWLWSWQVPTAQVLHRLRFSNAKSSQLLQGFMSPLSSSPATQIFEDFHAISHPTTQSVPSVPRIWETVCCRLAATCWASATCAATCACKFCNTWKYLKGENLGNSSGPLISIIIFAMIRPWSFGMVMVCRADILVDIVDILRYFMCGWSQAYHRRSKMHQREHIFSFCLAAWHYQIMTNRIQQALSNMLHNIYIYIHVIL